MTDAQRCPVRVMSWYPFRDIEPDDRERFTKWISDDRLDGAEFRYRHTDHAGWFAVLHRSTKSHGRWQLSWFDSEGAIGDIDRATADECLTEVRPHSWRLVALKTKGQRQ